MVQLFSTTKLYIFFLIGDCRNLQDLNISSCEGVDDDVIRDISVGCPTLLYMNMSRTEISDASLRNLSRFVSIYLYIPQVKISVNSIGGEVP